MKTFQEWSLLQENHIIQDLYKTIKQMTSDNEHGIARIALAKFLNETDLVKKYEDIINAQKRLGYLSSLDKSLRDKYDKELFTKASDSLIPEDFNLIKSAF